MSKYTFEEVISLYELGRHYFDLGYFGPAERIFNGLVEVDGGHTPARIGIGLVKLERDLASESISHFRTALNGPKRYHLQAKLGLCSAFINLGEIARAQSVLSQIAKDHGKDFIAHPALQKLSRAFEIRVNS